MPTPTPSWLAIARHVAPSARSRATVAASTPFDGRPSRFPFARAAILAEDTSRLSRKLADVLNLCDRLNFAGVRVCFVAQGIDSSEDHKFQLLLAG